MLWLYWKDGIMTLANLEAPTVRNLEGLGFSDPLLLTASVGTRHRKASGFCCDVLAWL